MAAALPFISYAATALQVIGAMQQGSAQASQATGQAEISKYNAEISRQQSDAALRASASEQMAMDRERRQMMGRSRASAAQSGLGFTGSNRDVLERTDTLAELDILNRAYDGMLKSRGFLAQAEIDEYGASIAQQNARNAKTGGLLRAGGAILGSASSIFGGGTAAPGGVMPSLGSGLRLGGIGTGLSFAGRRFG